jgi:dimethylaniline monooxygenase (N-oxide forming)
MTQKQHRQRVAVIGGGVAGLVSAKVLKHDGFDVTLFEKEPTVGGVWAASRAYPGLRTNNPRETYAFSDLPYPQEADEFPTAAQVRDYLESYVQYFGLEPHLSLATEVQSVVRSTTTDAEGGARFRVTVQPAHDGQEPETHDFDYVVMSNGVFSMPYVPRFDGQEDFAGSVHHSSQIIDPEAFTDRHVVVAGAGKSALDCAAFIGNQAASCTLVFRTAHWMLPRYFGPLRVDRVMFTRLSELTLPAYHRATRVERFLRRVAAPLLSLLRHVLGAVSARLVGMPRPMIPDRPFHTAAENIGIGDAFYRALRTGAARALRARIVRYEGPNHVRLDTGEQLRADSVVFATGWRQDLTLLDPGLRQDVEREGRFRLYRHILPPRERRLGFIGYASSANSPLTSEVAAHWLSETFQGRLPLPEPNAMDEEIDRVGHWARQILPKRSEGYFIGGYVAHYADELLRDMGLSTRRANNLLTEYFAPLWAERYRKLATERQSVSAIRD